MARPVATIFGGSGFIGRYIVQRLARRGWILRIAVRRPDEALFLKPLGDVGQITPIAANIRHDASVAAAVAGVDHVINLVGILYRAAGRSASPPSMPRAPRRVARRRQGRRGEAPAADVGARRRSAVALALCPHQGRGRGDGPRGSSPRP